MSGYVLATDEKNPQKIVTAINQLAQGRSNATGSCTLTAGASSTTVSARNCGAGSVVLLSPRTAHAAAELAAGSCYISAVALGSFTLAHANNAQIDRTFGYVCLG